MTTLAQMPRRADRSMGATMTCPAPSGKRLLAARIAPRWSIAAATATARPPASQATRSPRATRAMIAKPTTSQTRSRPGQLPFAGKHATAQSTTTTLCCSTHPRSLLVSKASRRALAERQLHRRRPPTHMLHQYRKTELTTRRTRQTPQPPRPSAKSHLQKRCSARRRRRHRRRCRCQNLRSSTSPRAACQTAPVPSCEVTLLASDSALIPD
mmetsp:Transcript_1308/g.3857  ORF Transcript_1308/g.3857 Transcript_1308/m.3857 type:complete len:212 (-) Transcript_1308:204-839(-)